MSTVLMFSAEAMANYASSAIFTIINLAVSFFILYRFLFKPIIKVLRDRREYVANELADADQKLKDAAERISEAELRLDRSQHDAADIITNARSQAEIQAESILSDAKRESAVLLTRAEGEISRMRISMLNGIRDEVADLSVAIASKVIGGVMNEKRQRELVEQFIDAEMAEKLPDQAASGPATAKSGVNTNG